MAQCDPSRSPSGGCSRKHIAIIGAGISGLSAAYSVQLCARLYDTPCEMTILESSDRAGGVIKTLSIDDSVIECGPEAFATFKSGINEIVKQLGLSSQVLNTNEKHRRTFIACDQKLHPLPEGFVMFAPSRIFPVATSTLFSMSAKLRMALEPIYALRQRTNEEETVAEFVRRHFGNEVLAKVGEPMVGGIYGGSADVLSADATLPQLVEMEKEYGSLLLALWKSGRNGRRKQSDQRGSGPRYSMLASFDKGLQSFIDALVNELPPDSIKYNTAVLKVDFGRNGRRWDVLTTDGTLYSADAVILACPARTAGSILSELDGVLSSLLQGIKYSSAAVVNLLYAADTISHKLDGFGFVVPRSECLSISACTFTSVKFRNRTPDGKILLRAFVNKDELLALSDGDLSDLIHKDLQKYLGLSGQPLMSMVTKFPLALPQYVVGHTQTVAGIEASLKRLPGIALAGNAYKGVGLADCAASGGRAAELAFRSLAKAGSQPVAASTDRLTPVDI